MCAKALRPGRKSRRPVEPVSRRAGAGCRILRAPALPELETLASSARGVAGADVGPGTSFGSELRRDRRLVRSGVGDTWRPPRRSRQRRGDGLGRGGGRERGQELSALAVSSGGLAGVQRGVQRWMGGAGQFLLHTSPWAALSSWKTSPRGRGAWVPAAAGRARPCAPCRGPRHFSWGQGSAPAAEGQDFPAEGTFPGLECCVAPPGKFFASDWRFGGYLIVFQ